MNRLKSIVGSTLVSVSLLTGSAAAASTPTSVSPPADSWATLSMLSTASAGALAGSTAAVAQPDTLPPPPSYAGPTRPPVPVLVVWALVLGTIVYIATRNHGHHRVPNSPA